MSARPFHDSDEDIDNDGDAPMSFARHTARKKKYAKYAKQWTFFFFFFFILLRLKMEVRRLESGESILSRAAKFIRSIKNLRFLRKKECLCRESLESVVKITTREANRIEMHPRDAATKVTLAEFTLIAN